jgi:NCAIR mutase (PurE)-related protein
VTPARLRELLGRVARGELDAEAAIEELSTLPFSEVESALVDSHREIRTGIPEVVFGQGKTPEQTIGIVRALRANGQSALVTRVAPGVATLLCAELADAEYDTRARVLRSGPPLASPIAGARVAVVSAGTADRPVADEAAATLAFLGVEPVRIEDVGVAGLHRLLANVPRIRETAAAIVVAGMEGALPSVVGGPSIPGHRRAHQRRVWRELRRAGGAAGDAELVRGRRDRGQHRQRFRRCGSGDTRVAHGCPRGDALSEQASPQIIVANKSAYGSRVSRSSR